MPPAASFYLYLIRGNQGHTAPSKLALEGGDGTWMGHKECGLFPDEAQQFVDSCLP